MTKRIPYLRKKLYHKSAVKTFFYKLVWVATYILVWPIIRLFYKMEIEFDKSIRVLRRPVILISNHKNPFDPWLVSIALPFSTFWRILPVAIMGSKHFASSGLNLIGKMGIINLVYGAYGVVSLPHLKEREDKLRPFMEALENKASVLIFPEGKMRQEENVGPFKEGVALLHLSTGAPIFPASIKFKGYGWRKSCLVRFGKSLTFDKNSAPFKITEQVKSAVEELYAK